MDTTGRRAGRLALIGGLLTALAGCYAYTPADDGSPERGAQVRLHLSPAGARMASEQTGDGGSRLQGRLVTAGGDSVAVRVARSVREPTLGARSQTTGTRYVRVTLPDSVVRSVETRSLSVWKTGALAGAGAVALRLFLELPDAIGGGGSGPNDTPPGGQPFLVPIR